MTDKYDYHYLISITYSIAHFSKCFLNEKEHFLLHMSALVISYIFMKKNTLCFYNQFLGKLNNVLFYTNMDFKKFTFSS